MNEISRPVIRKDHEAKVTGQEKYVNDFRFAADGGEILTARLVRAQKAHAEIRKVSTRSSIAISNISVASVWNIENKVIKELSIGIGSATEYPMRCTDMENLRIGKSLEEVEKERDEVLAGYVAELDMPPDRTGIDYRKQVCYRLLHYLLYEEFTPIRFDDLQS